jgi:predicted NBD/HSP70 family sugar kinase
MKSFLEDLGRLSPKQQVQAKQAIQFFVREGDRTIPEFCQISLLSVPTATKAITELVERGILMETGRRESGGGRPPAKFGVNPKAGYVISMELTLNLFKIQIVNLAHEVIYEQEIDDFDITRRDESFALLERIVPAIIAEQQLTIDKILGVGIGITGRVNSKNGSSHSYLNFQEPLVTLLQRSWNLPVFIDNDTHLMTLGEQTFGLAQGVENALFINLSRGLGVGLISGGNIHIGGSGFAGEFGHIPFSENNRQCICGKTGCLETVVSGIALESLFEEQTGERFSYHHLLKRANAGDVGISAMLTQMGENLGKAASILIQSAIDCRGWWFCARCGTNKIRHSTRHQRLWFATID